MKLKGKISTYNGEYGTIITSSRGIIDFEKKDISLNQTLNVGDIVEFRVENRFPNIKIARNITKKISE